MHSWYMLTLVGRDRPGIVAAITRALFEGGANLGETSMVRLGGNFAVMMMVEYKGATGDLEKLIDPAAANMGLRAHVDVIEGELHHHVEPNLRISVYGADRAGIVADITGALAGAGFNIVNLESDVGGSESAPIYVLHIEGVAGLDPKEVETLLKGAAQTGGVEVRVAAIDTLMG